MTKIISLSGPSGTGKTTTLKRPEKQRYRRVTPVTTREKRERESEDYIFLSLEEYRQLEERRELVLSFFFFENHYGYRSEELKRVLSDGNTPVLEIYTKVVPIFKETLPDSYSLFMMPENIDLLENRMIKRGDSRESIERRLKFAEEEIEFYRRNKDFFDYTILISRDDSEEIVESKLLEGLRYA